MGQKNKTITCPITHVKNFDIIIASFLEAVSVCILSLSDKLADNTDHLRGEAHIARSDLIIEVFNTSAQ